MGELAVVSREGVLAAEGIREMEVEAELAECMGYCCCAENGSKE